MLTDDDVAAIEQWREERWAEALAQAARLGHTMGQPQRDRRAMERDADSEFRDEARCTQDGCQAVITWRFVDPDLDEDEMFGPDAQRVPHPASWEDWQGPPTSREPFMMWIRRIKQDGGRQ
jgi:hypothetical protein